MSKRNNINILLFVSLIILLLGLFTADLLLGSVKIPVSDIFLALRGKSSEIYNQIILEFRLPKAITAVVAGMALSVCGLQMQTIFRNPLAGPDVLGINAGASLGVALLVLGFSSFFANTIFTVTGAWSIVIMAWIGSGAVLLLILLISVRVRDIMTILILGILFSGAVSSLVSVLQYFSNESMLKSFVIWTMGSLGGVTSTQLKVLVPSLIIGLLISFFMIKQLDVIMLGEKYSLSTGVNVQVVRALIFISTSIMAGSVTAFCGPIAFIGVAVPHLSRMLFKTSSHFILLPATILIGSVTMLLSDIISQLPGLNITLPINAITSILGVPVIIWIIFKNKRMEKIF
jgi:iron complex transport system permease protein